MMANTPKPTNPETENPVKRDGDLYRFIYPASYDQHTFETNFQGTGIERLKFSSECEGEDDIEDSDMMREGLHVKYWYCHRVRGGSTATEEGNEFLRLVLVDTKGVRWSCSSLGCIRDLSRFANTLGFGPFDPPLHLKLRIIKTRAGRSVHTFQIVT